MVIYDSFGITIIGVATAKLEYGLLIANETNRQGNLIP